MTAPLSIIHGIPLDQEPGLGALTLPGYLREVTQRYAPREALVFHHPDGRVERWSYAELHARSMAVARALVACGLGKEERVGVMMTNRPEWISSAFGASLAGGVVTGLSTFSTPNELEYLIKASGISVLLFEGQVLKKDFASILREIEPGIATAKPGAFASTKFPFLRRLAVVGEGAGGAIERFDDFLKHGETVAPALVDARADAVQPADPGVLLFSSGSTGKPKGVLSAHRGVCIMCWRWRRVNACGDAENEVRAWSANGFFWSGNFAGSLGATLSSGGSNVLQSTFDPAEALRLMETEKVTRAYAWPHQYQALAAAPNWNDVNLSHLHYVDPNTALGKHPTIRTDWHDANAAYGNTETFTLSTCFPSDVPMARVGNSHGEALPGNTIRIVDPLTGAVVPRGERGEICVKGPTLMLGYLGVPLAETLDAEGFFRTNDGGWIDDQDRLHWEGRLNDIIKTGGANVSPLEVDGVIAEHPDVRVVRSVGIPHETLGELIVACIVPREGTQPTEAAIRDYAREKLASYKVPRRVVFVREDELALTGSAKIKLSDLRELAQKRVAAGGG
ncbi:MAG: class I adenylate-forming enzyme family protein [Solimonas sp.]